METLVTLFPNVEDLLAAVPEELGPILLRLAAARRPNNGNFVSLAALTDEFSYDALHSGNRFMAGKCYPLGQKAHIEAQLSVSWDWLRNNGLIAPAPGANGQSGWMVVTRKGEDTLSSPENSKQLRDAQAFPKELLHPQIADNVTAAVRRNDLSGAVFTAFKAVEEAVRDAGGFSMSDLGVDLMRRAFKPGTGPLTDVRQPTGEQEARQHLFAGAIGCYKNPNSHRTDPMDLRDAQEQALLASHLLRIVDVRRAAFAPKSS